MCVCVALTRRSCRCWAASWSSLEPAISEAPLLPSAWRLNPGSDSRRPRPAQKPGLRGQGLSKCSLQPHPREPACGLTLDNPESTTAAFRPTDNLNSDLTLLFSGNENYRAGYSPDRLQPALPPETLISQRNAREGLQNHPGQKKCLVIYLNVRVAQQTRGPRYCCCCCCNYHFGHKRSEHNHRGAEVCSFALSLIVVCILCLFK